MNASCINILERKKELGYSNDGEKVTNVGHIYGYLQYMGISVLEVEKDGQINLVFMALNNTLDSVTQIMEKEEIAELTKAWSVATKVNFVAGKKGLN